MSIKRMDLPHALVLKEGVGLCPGQRPLTGQQPRLATAESLAGHARSRWAAQESCKREL